MLDLVFFTCHDAVKRGVVIEISHLSVVVGITACRAAVAAMRESVVLSLLLELHRPHFPADQMDISQPCRETKCDLP